MSLPVPVSINPNPLSVSRLNSNGILAVGRLLRLAQASSPSLIDDGIRRLDQISQEHSCWMASRWRRQHGTVHGAFQAGAGARADCPNLTSLK